MGPRVMRHLPKYVHGFVDRHGRPRFYFRRAGFKKVPLPGLPWSPEFMAAYQEVLGADLTIAQRTMLRLALSFFTWRTLARESNLERDAAVRVMVQAIDGAKAA